GFRSSRFIRLRSPRSRDQGLGASASAKATADKRLAPEPLVLVWLKPDITYSYWSSRLLARRSPRFLRATDAPSRARTHRSVPSTSFGDAPRLSCSPLGSTPAPAHRVRQRHPRCHPTPSRAAVAASAASLAGLQASECFSRRGCHSPLARRAAGKSRVARSVATASCLVATRGQYTGSLTGSCPAQG